MTAQETATPVTETGVAFPLERAFPVQLDGVLSDCGATELLTPLQEIRQQLPGVLNPFINERYPRPGMKLPQNYYRFLDLIKRGELHDVHFDFDDHRLVLQRVLNPRAVRSAVAFGTTVLSSSGCTVYPLRRINFY